MAARTGAGARAADLAAEVFAHALRAREGFDPESASAEPWLQTIARNVLIDSIRRSRVEDRARRALGIAALPLTDEDLGHVDALIDEARGLTPPTVALAAIPPEQAEAVRARVVDEEEYDVIASRLGAGKVIAKGAGWSVGPHAPGRLSARPRALRR